MSEPIPEVHGISDEKANSIILHAAKKPSVVIDAYERRIMQRLGLIKDRKSYAALGTQLMKNTQRDVKIYNEYHALFVLYGKERCQSCAPLRSGCLLSDMCAQASTAK